MKERNKRRAARAKWMRDDRRRYPEKYQIMERRRRGHRRVYERRRYQSDELWNLMKRIRARIRAAVEGKGGKLDNSVGLLGCAPSEFRTHIGALFLPGMSWANRSLWHIDHKKPLASFDLSTHTGQCVAFHYSNTQPLWAVDNIRKGAKINFDG
jgi:hypothetical protein